jgi:hypothetical protein
MKVSNLGRGEYLAMLGGAFLGVSLFVPKFYEARPGTNATIAGCSGCVVSLWQAHPIMRWLLLAAAAAPFILAWIIVRDHELSWPRGQVTSLVAIAAAGLLFYNGIVDRPGETVRGEVELDWAWYTAFGGSLAMLLGSFLRTAESETRRKPPGVL